MLILYVFLEVGKFKVLEPEGVYPNCTGRNKFWKIPSDSKTLNLPTSKNTYD